MLYFTLFFESCKYQQLYQMHIYLTLPENKKIVQKYIFFTASCSSKHFSFKAHVSAYNFAKRIIMRQYHKQINKKLELYVNINLLRVF